MTTKTSKVQELTVVVTGGASGIGAAVCRRVVEGGGYVAILDLDLEAATVLSGELAPRAFAARANVLDETELTAARENIAGKLPPVNGLVNCAGIAQIPKPIEEYPVEDWARVVDSHLKGTYVS